MKKLLTLAAALLFTGAMTAQKMMELPQNQRFHAMSENGKYMVYGENGVVGVFNTETEEYKEFFDNYETYMLGTGNMVTDDGYIVGAVNESPAILDIEKGEWTMLPIKESDERKLAAANAITPSRKYVIGYTSTDKGFGGLMIKPVIWTQQEDGSYGMYEDLPYPEKDFTGAAPKYILTNCVSADGNVIAAQLLMQDNYCLPMVYRKAQDGSWTYEVYDKGLCEEGLTFPEFPDTEPVLPNQYDYMTEEEIAAYRQDSIEYRDSLNAFRYGEIETPPTYYPDQKNYMSDEARESYEKARAEYNAVATEYSEKLMAYRQFFSEHVTKNFYEQNIVWLSSNGKYYATTALKNYVHGDAVMFTVGDDGLEMNDHEDGLSAYCATNDGDLFVSDGVTAQVYPADGGRRITLPDWLRAKGETEAADWLENSTTSGLAICSGNGRVLSGYYRNTGGYTSWIIKLDDTATGISEIENEADPTAHVKVYDLQGCFIKEAPAANATDGLAKGIYIINNKKVIVK